MIPLIYTRIEKTDSPVVYVVAAAMLLGVVIAFIRLVRSGAALLKDEKVKTGNTSYTDEQMSAVSFQLSNFIYFRNLSPKGKTEFVRRVMNFIETHEMEGEDDFNPSLPDKIHVAAAATQLTFGLEDFIFTHFDTVILYPGIFQLRPEGPFMKGATTPNGVIRISIKDFESGYANPADKLNVGLHEFGHALFMEFLKLANDDEDPFVKNALHAYLEPSDKMLSSGKDADNFLRDYAFTNRHEFFAVCVEHFFEAPEEFSEKLPQLFGVMKNLLRQDPRGILPDYGIKRVAQLITQN